MQVVLTFATFQKKGRVETTLGTVPKELCTQDTNIFLFCLQYINYGLIGEASYVQLPKCLIKTFFPQFEMWNDQRLTTSDGTDHTLLCNCRLEHFIEPKYFFICDRMSQLQVAKHLSSGDKKYFAPSRRNLWVWFRAVDFYSLNEI